MHTAHFACALVLAVVNLPGQASSRIAYEGKPPGHRAFVLVLSGPRAPFLAIPRKAGGHYPAIIEDFDSEVLGFTVPDLDFDFAGELSKGGDRIRGFLMVGSSEYDLELSRIDDDELTSRIGRPQFVPGDVSKAVEELMQRAEAFGFSGQVVVEHRGKRLVDGAYGMADDKNRIPVTPDTAFGIASMSKSFTAAAVLALVQNGKLRIDERLDEFFVDLPAAVRDVTVKQLLEHSSGLGHPRRQIGIPKRILSDHERHALFARYLELERSLWSTPTWEYCNFGYQLLAEIVSLRSEQPFEEFLRERLLLPNGLEHTGFYGENRWDKRLLAHAYWGGDQGTPADWPGLHNEIRGNSGMVSSARQLTRWVIALAAGKVIDQNLLDSAWSIEVPIQSRRDGPLLGYGYGWFVSATLLGAPLIEHGGDYVLGYSGWLAHWPNDELSLAITCNRRDHDGNWLRAGVEGALQRILWGRSYSMPPNARSRRGREGSDLLGEWRSSGGASFLVDDIAGQLQLSAGNQAGIVALLELRGESKKRLRNLNRAAPRLASRYQDLVQAIATHDPGRTTFDLATFTPGWQKNIIGRRGTFIGVDLLGSTLSGESRTSTYLRVHCLESDTLLRFDEENGGWVYWEYDAAAPEPIAMAPSATAGHQWIAHDLFTDDTISIRLEENEVLELQAANVEPVKLERYGRSK